jgi:hypothetical protein
MTTTSGQRPKRTKWSACPQLSELALMLDAVPPGLRMPLLQSAIGFIPESDFETSNIVSEIRSVLVDCLAAVFGRSLRTKFTSTDQLSDVEQVIFRFSSCQDPADVQLAVCDLLECLAVTASLNE